MRYDFGESMFDAVDDDAEYVVLGWTGNAWRTLFCGNRPDCLSYARTFRTNNQKLEPTDIRVIKR